MPVRRANGLIGDSVVCPYFVIRTAEVPLLRSVNQILHTNTHLSTPQEGVAHRWWSTTPRFITAVGSAQITGTGVRHTSRALGTTTRHSHNRYRYQLNPRIYGDHRDATIYTLRTTEQAPHQHPCLRRPGRHQHRPSPTKFCSKLNYNAMV